MNMKLGVTAQARLGWNTDEENSLVRNEESEAPMVVLDVSSLPETTLARLEQKLFRKRAQDALHEAADPLSVIMNLTDTLRHNSTLNDEGQADLAVMAEQVVQLKEIVEDLRQRLDQPDPAPFQNISLTGQFVINLD